MTTSLIVSNLWSWSLELTLLVLAAGLVSRLLANPQWRLHYWQAIIVAALLLPLAAPRKQPSPIAPVAGSSVSITIHDTAAISLAREPEPGSRVLQILAAGAMLRLLWLCVGCYRLRRLRLQAAPLRSAPVAASTPTTLHKATWYESPAVNGPVTFGWRRPSILLPQRLRELPDHLRTAIAWHELIHVRRRDWLFVVAEELLRSVLWFQPAIWYALSQVQLAREHAVDRETVSLTGNRDSYLDALLAVAEHRLQPDVAPASLFLKKRQLASRLSALVKKETTMPRSRLFARLVAAISTAAVAAIIAVSMFPLQSPAQVVADDPGVSVDPGAKLLHRTPVRYPAGASNGTVLVEASVNAKGEVSDARVLNGPDDLRKSALESVLEWHYSTDTAPPPTVRITMQFNRAPAAAAVRPIPTTPEVKGGLPAEAVQWTGPISDIRFVGLTPELQQQVENRLPVRKGDNYGRDTYGATVAALSSVDEHLNLTVQIARDGGPVSLIIALRPAQPFAPPPPPPPPPAPASAAPPGNIQVAGNVQSEKLITKVPPVYPPLARQARIQGTVHLSVTISKEGTVDDVYLISGHPLLVQSATDAVRQWVYKPTLLNGSPVAVITQVDVNFSLVP